MATHYTYEDSIEYDLLVGNHSPYLDTLSIHHLLSESELNSVYLLKDNFTSDYKIMRVIPKNNSTLSEFKYLETLNHPNLAKTTALWQTERFIYLLTTFVEGITLKEFILNEGTLSGQKIFDLLTPILDVLHYFHSQSPAIIYRDLKPENVIVTPGGHIVLIDLGATRTFDVLKTSDTVMIGTHGYASPEAYGFSQTDQRSDVYSFGKLLYFSLTGSSVKHTGNHSNILDPLLEHVFLKCTNFTPDQRYQTIAELKEEFRYRSLQLFTYAKLVNPYRPIIEWISNDDPITDIKLATPTHVLKINIKHTTTHIELLNDNLPEPLLLLDSEYLLTLTTKNKMIIQLSFRTDSHPKLCDIVHEGVIYIPSNPDLGFYHPYYLSWPTGSQSLVDVADRLLVIPNNTKIVSNQFELHKVLVYSDLTGEDIHNGYQNKLNTIRLTPIFPRPVLSIDDKPFYTHFFDRNIISYTTDDQEHLELIRLDNQLSSMIEHAIAYLNDNYIPIQKKCLFFGTGSQGHFIYRFALFHKEQVLGMACLHINGHLTFPVEDHLGKSVPFPIGLAGVRHLITDEDLDTFKRLPKLIYMNEKDTNNVFTSTDCYYPNEIEAAKTLIDLTSVSTMWKDTQILLKKYSVQVTFITSTMSYRGLSTEDDGKILTFMKDLMT